jgi:hypothetical protein
LLSKQLQDENTEQNGNRKQIGKLTANSSAIVANTIGKIGDMPTVLHQEVTLNKQAGEIKHKQER